jgi:hypothetical protein
MSMNLEAQSAGISIAMLERGLVLGYVPTYISQEDIINL